MAIKRKIAKFAPFLQSAVVVLISALFVSSVVFAATTISSDITTNGNLTVDGRASSSSATSSLYLIVGDDFTVPPGFDFDEDLAVSGDALIANKATTTVALWVGGAASPTYINEAGGDLYVQDDIEFDGNLYGGVASVTSATSTNYLMVGDAFAIPPGFNYDADLAVSGDVVIANKATTTVALWVGGAADADNLDLTGGDLYVQDGLEVDGGAWFGSATTTDSLVVGGYASTTGDLFVMGGTADFVTSSPTTTSGIFSRDREYSTSTVGIGEIGHQVGCLEMVATDGTYFNCFIDVNASGIETALVCVIGRCNPSD